MLCGPTVLLAACASRQPLGTYTLLAVGGVLVVYATHGGVLPAGPYAAVLARL
jgi:hypothetical protein